MTPTHLLKEQLPLKRKEQDVIDEQHGWTLQTWEEKQANHERPILYNFTYEMSNIDKSTETEGRLVVT